MVFLADSTNQSLPFSVEVRGIVNSRNSSQNETNRSEIKPPKPPPTR